jgi:HEAT repeat protein
MISEAHFPNARAEAAQTLGEIGPEARQAIPVLEKVVKEDQHARSVAEEALRKIRGKKSNYR